MSRPFSGLPGRLSVTVHAAERSHLLVVGCLSSKCDQMLWGVPSHCMGVMLLDIHGLIGCRGLSPVPGTGLEHTGRRGSGVDRIASWVQTLNPEVVRGVKG